MSRALYDATAAALIDAGRHASADATAAAALICDANTIWVAGIGKSYLIAQTISATMRSLGVRANALHAVEAAHGDLGAVRSGDAAIVVSHSGESPELEAMLRRFERLSLPVVAVTGARTSALTRAAHCVCCYGPVQETCPIGLAPSASLVIALVVLQEIAFDVAREVGSCTPEDFRLAHPGGSLGARLRDAGTAARKPVFVSPVADWHAVADALSTGSGLVVVGTADEVVGVLTDGDLRRADPLTFRAGSAASRNPYYVEETTTVRDAVAMMNHHRVTKILVRSGGRITGVLNLHDCARPSP